MEKRIILSIFQENCFKVKRNLVQDLSLNCMWVFVWQFWLADEMIFLFREFRHFFKERRDPACKQGIMQADDGFLVKCSVRMV